MDSKIILGKSEDGEIALDPDKLLATSMIVQAFSGGGKSGIIRLVCEQSPIPFIILDLEGEFASLREKVDLILVGPQGDIPTDIRSAALLARKLVELRVSAVIDLFEFSGPSRLSVVERRREYVAAFCTALMNLPKPLWQPLILVLDELQIICPQQNKGQKGVESLQPVIDVAAAGRKRGICVLGATQRFSKVDNDALAELKNVFIGGTWLDADQKRAADYLGLSSTNDRRALRDLPKQNFYCFGPALSLHGVHRFQSDKCLTSFPKPGVSRNIAPPKASDAITQIVLQIDDLPAEAEQEKRDIESLKSENADLKRQLAERPTVPEPVETIKEIEVPAITPEVFNAANDLADTISNKIVDLTRDLSVNLAEFGDVAETMRDVLRRCSMWKTGDELFIPDRPVSFTEVTQARGILPSKPPSSKETIDKLKQPSSSQFLKMINEKRASRDEASTDLSPLHRLILNGIALFEALKERHPTIAQVGMVIGKHHNSGPIRGAFNQLHDRGLAEISGANISLTDAGRSEAVMPDIRSREDIHNLWFQRLQGNELAFLRVLVDLYPRSVELTALGDAIGKNINSGPIRGALNKLLDKGLAYENSEDRVSASPLMFPEGLK